MASFPKGALYDNQLLCRARAGERDAFDALARRHSDRILAISLRILRNSADAEDNVQNVLCKAYVNLWQFKENALFSTWLIRITINEALMILRQKRAYTPLSDATYEDTESPFILNLPDRAPTPEQSASTNELRAALVQAVSGLRKNLRSVVLLREFQGLTNEETARRLNLSVAAVKARLFHARRWLRRRLEGKFNLIRNGSRFDKDM